MIRLRTRRIPRLPIRHQCHIATGDVVTIKLVPLAAADILSKKNVVSAVRMKPPASDGVREKRQLLPRPARRLHQMKLRRLRKPRRNQHLSFCGMPIRQTGTSIRRILACGFRHRCGYLRHAVHDQIVCWRNDLLLRRRTHGNKQRRCQNHHESVSHRSPSPTNPPLLLTPQTIGHASRTTILLPPERVLKFRCNRKPAMFRKILIAKRGEIAVCILRACHELGVRSAAVFSDVDRKSLHVRLADEAYSIGPAPSRESYLCIDKLMDVARRAGCDAVHPGYGFLAENPAFARACAENSITFIGPSPKAMELLGSKTAARQLAARAGVPMVPGVQDPIEDIKDAERIARELGYPVLLKAVAGGGGKGMRLVAEAAQLPAAW